MQFRGSYAHVYNYSNSILKTSSGACFNNHLKDLGYLDFCGNAHKTFKNFTIDQRNDINIFGSKFLVLQNFGIMRRRLACDEHLPIRIFRTNWFLGLRRCINPVSIPRCLQYLGTR